MKRTPKPRKRPVKMGYEWGVWLPCSDKHEASFVARAMVKDCIKDPALVRRLPIRKGKA